MKVLAKGRQQKGWSREETCTGLGNGGGGCGAKLLIEQPDIFKTYVNCRDETDTYHTFKCCECGVKTDMRGVPPSLKVREKESDEPYRYGGPDRDMGVK